MAVGCVEVLCLSWKRISVQKVAVDFAVLVVEAAADSTIVCSLAALTSNVAHDFLCPYSPCCDDVGLCLPCYVIRTEVSGSFWECVRKFADPVADSGCLFPVHRESYRSLR